MSTNMRRREFAARRRGGVAAHGASTAACEAAFRQGMRESVPYPHARGGAGTLPAV